MNQLLEIDKPVGLLNAAGYFTAFLEFVDHMVATQFLPAAHRHSISVDGDASALIDKLRLEFLFAGIRMLQGLRVRGKASRLGGCMLPR